jgi:hypothetical protein
MHLNLLQSLNLNLLQSLNLNLNLNLTMAPIHQQKMILHHQQQIQPLLLLLPLLLPVAPQTLQIAAPVDYFLMDFQGLQII